MENSQTELVTSYFFITSVHASYDVRDIDISLVLDCSF